MIDRPRLEFDRKSVLSLLAFFWFPFLVYLLHVFLARVVHAYAACPRIDVPMHFLGGVAITTSFYGLFRFLQERKKISVLDRGVLLLLLFCLAVTAAVFWEFAEFLQDYYFDTNSQISKVNIMRDLFVGTMGSLSAIIVLRFRRGSARRSP